MQGNQLKHILFRKSARPLFRFLENQLRSCVLTVAAVLSCTAPLFAGGGWIDQPWSGGVRAGFDHKYQPDAIRRDENGNPYTSLHDLIHDYRFAFVTGDVGLPAGFELDAVVTYLWAQELVDTTSEDPSRIYHGFSDMYVGVKYQLLSGAFPTAVGFSVRLPMLYQSSSTLNGQLLTNIPGLFTRDYDLTAYCSHSFDAQWYASLQSGFKLREGAFAHQITFAMESGYRLPVLDNRFLVQAVIDGAFSVGGPGYASSLDRFQPTQEFPGHFFNYNNASYVRPTLAVNADIIKHLSASFGVSLIAWGINVDVYHEFFVQTGYAF